MAIPFAISLRLARLGLVVLLGAGALLPTGMAQAASTHTQGMHANNGGDTTPFDVDQFPCDTQMDRHHGGGGHGNPNCPDTFGSTSHNNDGSSHPGSRAFGLQFSSDN